MSRVRTRREDGVLVVELCDGRDSALSREMVAELGAALGEAADPAVGAVLLLGGEEVFCSGAPRSLLEELATGAVEPTDVAAAAALLDVPVPAVAGMEGHAVGGGLALGFCADIVVMAEESRYGAPFMSYGFTPGMGSTRLLEHALSPAVAHELLYTGELRRGRDFAGRSGVNHVVPRAQVRATALDIALRIADNPRRALELLKATLAAPRRAAFAAAIREEARMHEETFRDSATLARIRAQFIEEP